MKKPLSSIFFATSNILSPFGFVSILCKIPPSFWQIIHILELKGVTIDRKRFAEFEVDKLSFNIVVHDEDDVGLPLFGEINVAS